MIYTLQELEDNFTRNFEANDWEHWEEFKNDTTEAFREVYLVISKYLSDANIIPHLGPYGDKGLAIRFKIKSRMGGDVLFEIDGNGDLWYTKSSFEETIRYKEINLDDISPDMFK